MRTLGKLTTALLSSAVLGALVMGVRSIPDIRRYLKMRQM